MICRETIAADENHAVGLLLEKAGLQAKSSKVLTR